MKKIIVIIFGLLIMGCTYNPPNEPKRFPLTTDQIYGLMQSAYEMGEAGVDSLKMKKMVYDIWK